MIGNAQLGRYVAREAGFEFLERETAIPADASLVEDVRGEDVGFGDAHVVVVAQPFEAAIARAGTEERKEIADEIVVEVADVAEVEGVLVRDAASRCAPVSSSVVISAGADRALEIIHQRGIGRERNEIENLQRSRVNEAAHVGRVVEDHVAVAFEIERIAQHRPALT